MQDPKAINSTEHAGPKRLCMDCGEDISLLSPKALRCKRCAYEREKEKARERGRINYDANRELVLQRVKEYQKTPEYKQKHQEWEARNPQKILGYRLSQKQKHREQTGYNPEGRTCEKCHAELPEDAGHNAKFCDACKQPPTMPCKVCNEPLHGQGRRTGYCSKGSEGSKDCKQRYWRLKEEQGYTKVCTKCKEEKHHTDFGFHSGHRRSVCKRCEADATQGYYQALPVEERQERRRIHGQREREKEANLPREQKAILTTKRRQAQYRRKYGPDFDEDKLYSQQDGKCAICRKPAPLGKLEVDHGHKTHVEGTMHSVRGLLCKNCNLRLVSRYEKGFPPERQDWPYMNKYLARGKLS